MEKIIIENKNNFQVIEISVTSHKSKDENFEEEAFLFQYASF